MRECSDLRKIENRTNLRGNYSNDTALYLQKSLNTLFSAKIDGKLQRIHIINHLQMVVSLKFERKCISISEFFRM